MILIMSMQKYTTIRGISLKTSSLPITIEKMNATTLVYATVKVDPNKGPSMWMFHFLTFLGNMKIILLI